MGSSVHLRNDVELYGQISFEKIIIETFSNRDDANKHETELLTLHNANYSKLFYNKGGTALINKQFSIIRDKKKNKPNIPLDRDKPRPLCACGNITAINYVKNGKTYYRKKCHQCSQEKTTPMKPDWETAGYTKKIVCEQCGFRSIHADQIRVIKIEDFTFKSVCLNCEITVQMNGWKVGDLIPDF